MHEQLVSGNVVLYFCNCVVHLCSFQIQVWHKFWSCKVKLESLTLIFLTSDINLQIKN